MSDQGRRAQGRSQQFGRGTRKATGTADDTGTRQKVIDAAIRCILEQGFYRASSNAIAETAGLSWGVIQYYFGTRESLMLAVLEEGNSRLTATLAKADISGETLVERLEKYLAVLEEHYGDPTYLAYLQILLNLSHDRRTSEQTRAAMIGVGKPIDVQITRLTNQLFAGMGVRRRALRTLPFYVLRGLALSELMRTTLPCDTAPISKDGLEQRRLLARSVAMLIESETGAEVSSSAAR